MENDSKEGDRMQARAGEWKSGDIFSHRLFNYVAIILGWDPKCSQSEEWIRGMGVDRLEFGRNQPFCHVVSPLSPFSVRAAHSSDVETPMVDCRRWQ
jgi:heat shock protein HspQ